MEDGGPIAGCNACRDGSVYTACYGQQLPDTTASRADVFAGREEEKCLVIFIFGTDAWKYFLITSELKILMLCFKSKLVKTHQETFLFSCVLAEGSRGKVRAGKGLGWRRCWWVRRAIMSLEPASLALGRSFALQTGSLGTRAVPAASFAFASLCWRALGRRARKKENWSCVKTALWRFLFCACLSGFWVGWLLSQAATPASSSSPSFLSKFTEHEISHF